MAVSQGTTSGSLNAVVNYAEKYWFTGFQKSVTGVLMNTGCITAPDDFVRAEAGDLLSIHTFSNIGGGFVGESQTLEGNENLQTTGNFRCQYNETWDAVRIPSKRNVAQMRDRIDFSKPTLHGLFSKHTAATAVSVLQQAAGAYPTSIVFNGINFTGDNRKFVTGHNTVTAPTANRIFRPNGLTTDEAVSSAGASAAMTTEVIDEVLTRISASGGRDASSSFNTADGYIIGVLSNRQMLDLLNDAGSAMQLYQNQLSLAAGGDSDDLLKGTMFGKRAYVYKSAILFEDPFVAAGVNSTTSAEIADVRRAVFFGANAMCYASPYGVTLDSDDENVPLVPVVENFDYKRFTGHAVGNFYGVRTFVDANNTPANVYVLSTYAEEL